MYSSKMRREGLGTFAAARKIENILQIATGNEKNAR